MFQVIPSLLYSDNHWMLSRISSGVKKYHCVVKILLAYRFLKKSVFFTCLCVSGIFWNHTTWLSSSSTWEFLPSLLPSRIMWAWHKYLHRLSSMPYLVTVSILFYTTIKTRVNNTLCRNRLNLFCHWQQSSAVWTPHQAVMKQNCFLNTAVVTFANSASWCFI